ncbi:MAG: hypothetical protein JHC93_08345 [Parachlamydiales bacterium]|nr:hypothetical protein [Parachlamydiales bacterium]
MSDDFRILICGDLDYEEMVVDIIWKGHTVGIVTIENGPEKMEFEIYNHPEGFKWKFPLDDFLKIIDWAKRELISEYPIKQNNSND